MNNWVERMIRRRSLFRLAALVGGLVLLLSLGFSDFRYVYNFLGGPYEVGRTELDTVGDIERTPHCFIRVTGDKCYDTGLQQISVTSSHGRETGRSVEASYHLLAIGRKFLLVKSEEAPHTTCEGELVGMSSDLVTQLYDSKEMQEIRGQVYPFLLKEKAFREPGYIFTGVLALYLVFFFWQVIPAWRHFQDPSSHPVSERIRSWNASLDLSEAIRQELAASRFRRIPGWSMTERFVVLRSLFSFNVLRLEDMLWAYKKVTRHSVNLIPTHKTYEAVLCFPGEVATISGKEKKVHEALEFAAQRAPWALLGFSDDRNHLFCRNKDEFRQIVEQRRAKWVAQNGSRT